MTDIGTLVLGFVVGGAVGMLAGWLLASRRAVHPDERLTEELRRQVGEREAAIASERERMARAQAAAAAAEARREAAERLLAEQRELHRATLAEARAAQDKALGDLREAFRALSADALKHTHPEFVRLANETFAKFQESARGDLAQRQEAIQGLVEPLKQQLEAYQKRLQQSDAAQASTLGEVRKQLEMLSHESRSLASETQRFRMVLKSNPARGRWGEETLRRVVEAAGMSAHCDFSEQTQAGDGMPDLVVRLPGDRVIVVDAKVPELDFLQAIDAADEAARAAALASHAAKLRGTIKALAERDYPRQFPNALDHVVLFLPAESLFSAALEGDRDLIVWAASRRILLATPASLIAILRSVAASWQQHAQSENAREIASAAQELYARVSTFTEHLESLRAGLERANRAFNDAVGSYQLRVRPAGERLAALGGAEPGKDPADVQPLEGALRLPEG